MLSSESTEVVRATLSVGRRHRRYHRPVLPKDVRGSPHARARPVQSGQPEQGEQQKALAGAIAAFAALQLEPDADKVRTTLSRIAHKHASLGITAEQYAIVHKYLFEAIVEVLGAAVTPAVAKAWDEVYWLMADTLIALEADLYQSGGWEPGEVWRTVAVCERAFQSADTVTFVLSSLDGAPLPRFSPGQYVSVGVRLPDGARQIRQYSLMNPRPRTTGGSASNASFRTLHRTAPPLKREKSRISSTTICLRETRSRSRHPLAI